MSESWRSIVNGRQARARRMLRTSSDLLRLSGCRFTTFIGYNYFVNNTLMLTIDYVDLEIRMVLNLSF